VQLSVHALSPYSLFSTSSMRNYYFGGIGLHLTLVDQRKPFAFELFFCLANAFDTSKGQWFSMKNYPSPHFNNRTRTCYCSFSLTVKVLHLCPWNITFKHYFW